ncbi:MAG TPA: hypothetical protein VGE42_02305 [Candidatus Dormibacteraeota bacterium]
MRTPRTGWRRARCLLATATVLAAVTAHRPGPRLATTVAPAIAPVAVVVPAVHGGAVLDGFGGVHPFGGLALDTTGAPYWRGWDIARSLVVRADGGGGWELDGWGGIHAFGSATAVAAPTYWPQWDIGRAMVVSSTDAAGLADGRQGYVLDGWGGLHAWGGAPAIGTPAYTPGRDLARGLELHRDALGTPDGGWVLDAGGGIRAFGAAPAARGAVSPSAPVWQALHAAGGGGLYAVPRWGAISVLGIGVAPYWGGYADWGSWDILRDLVLVGASNPQAVAQPVSSAAGAALAWWSRAHGGATLDGWGGIHPFGGLALNTAGAPYWNGRDIARSLALREDGSGAGCSTPTAASTRSAPPRRWPRRCPGRAGTSPAPWWSPHAAPTAFSTGARATCSTASAGSTPGAARRCCRPACTGRAGTSPGAWRSTSTAPAAPTVAGCSTAGAPSTRPAPPHRSPPRPNTCRGATSPCASTSPAAAPTWCVASAASAPPRRWPRAGRATATGGRGTSSATPCCSTPATPCPRPSR